MEMIQQQFILKERNRGFHLITDEILKAVPQIGDFASGMCHVFICHTSASLTINENADPSVRRDFEMYFNKSVPENDRGYTHDSEGSDDMPAHLKASLLGSSVSVPVSRGKFALGTWQGIYLCEHRNHGGRRELVVTVWGSPSKPLSVQRDVPGR